MGTDSVKLSSRIWERTINKLSLSWSKSWALLLKSSTLSSTSSRYDNSRNESLGEDSGPFSPLLSISGFSAMLKNCLLQRVIGLVLCYFYLQKHGSKNLYLDYKKSKTNILFLRFASQSELAIAQLVERRTVEVYRMRSLGHWFESGSRDFIFSH